MRGNSTGQPTGPWLAAVATTDEHPNEHIPGTKETDDTMEKMVRSVPTRMRVERDYRDILST